MVSAPLLLATPALATPTVPTDDALVLERVPGARDPSSRALREMNAALAKDRRDVDLAVKVARLDIAQAREQGDPRFLGRAEAALASWPLAADTPTQVLLLRATILQSNHDFDASLAALDRVVKVDPRSGQAWLTLAAVHQARAEYEPALRDCGQIAGMVLGIVPAVCTASIMSLTGHATLALRAITLTLAQYQDEARASQTYDDIVRGTPATPTPSASRKARIRLGEKVSTGGHRMKRSSRHRGAAHELCPPSPAETL